MYSWPVIPNALYAVSMKGFRAETYKSNTGREIDMPMMRENLKRLNKYNVPYYVTFTNVSGSEVEEAKKVLSDVCDFSDSFSIELKHYNAIDAQTEVIK